MINPTPSSSPSSLVRLNLKGMTGLSGLSAGINFRALLLMGVIPLSLSIRVAWAFRDYLNWLILSSTLVLSIVDTKSMLYLFLSLIAFWIFDSFNYGEFLFSGLIFNAGLSTTSLMKDSVSLSLFMRWCYLRNLSSRITSENLYRFTLFTNSSLVMKNAAAWLETQVTVVYLISNPA